MAQTKIVNTPEVKSFPLKINSFDNEFCVVYFHGLMGSSSHKHVQHLIKDLNAKKIDNCTFDFFAHGERKKDESLADFTTDKYIEESKMVFHTLKLNGYKKFIIIGESFGGVLAQVLKTIKLDVIGIVYFFSTFDFTAPSDIPYEKILDCVENNKPMYVSSASGATKACLSPEFLKGIVEYQEERDELLKYQVGFPKLIINGTKDETCSYESAIEFAGHFKDAKLVLFETGHTGYDKDKNCYSPENTKMINKEILKFIGIIKAQLDYFK